MIYYPNEADISGWAANFLNSLDYANNPKTLQNLIDFLYKEGTKKIQIPGAKITPIELSEALDKKSSSDYLQALEPSAEGGRKLAKLFIDTLF